MSMLAHNSSSVSEPSPIDCSQALLAPSSLSIHYFSQHSLVWGGNAFSKYKLSCEHKTERIEWVKGCRGDVGNRAATLTACHGKIMTQTHPAREQT